MMSWFRKFVIRRLQIPSSKLSSNFSKMIVLKIFNDVALTTKFFTKLSPRLSTNCPRIFLVILPKIAFRNYPRNCLQNCPRICPWRCKSKFPKTDSKKKSFLDHVSFGLCACASVLIDSKQWKQLLSEALALLAAFAASNLMTQLMSWRPNTNFECDKWFCAIVLQFLVMALICRLSRRSLQQSLSGQFTRPSSTLIIDPK